MAWNSPSTQPPSQSLGIDTNKKNLMDYKSLRSELEVRKIMIDMFVPENIWKKYSDRPYGDISD